MIDHKRKVAFVHIPRTSGTSVEVAFNLVTEARKIHHYTASMLQKFVSDDFYWFSFVRNPWDRIVSAYHQPGNKRIGFLAGKSLEEFLNVWNGSSAPHEYGKTQSEYLDIPGINIFKFEEREKATKKLKQKYGIDISKHHARKTKNRKHYREYYNEKTKNMVAERFKEDIERFDYKY